MESDDLVILGWVTLIPIWPLWSIFAWFLEQLLKDLIKSWRGLDDGSPLERCILGFVLPILEYCSVVWCSAADSDLKLLHRAVSGARFLTGVCLSVILLIVDLLQFSVCCIRSGVNRCTRLIMRYLDRMCQCGLHEVPCPIKDWGRSL